MVKNQPTMQETWVQSLGQEDHLEKGMDTHFQYSCLENPMDRRVMAGCTHGQYMVSQWVGAQGD